MKLWIATLLAFATHNTRRRYCMAMHYHLFQQSERHLCNCNRFLLVDSCNEMYTSVKTTMTCYYHLMHSHHRCCVEKETIAIKHYVLLLQLLQVLCVKCRRFKMYALASMTRHLSHWHLQNGEATVSRSTLVKITYDVHFSLTSWTRTFLRWRSQPWWCSLGHLGLVSHRWPNVSPVPFMVCQFHRWSNLVNWCIFTCHHFVPSKVFTLSLTHPRLMLGMVSCSPHCTPTMTRWWC